MKRLFLMSLLSQKKKLFVPVHFHLPKASGLIFLKRVSMGEKGFYNKLVANRAGPAAEASYVSPLLLHI